MTLAAHWPRSTAQAAAGGGRSPRLAGKIRLFLKILKNCRIEDLKERNNFHTFAQSQFGLQGLQFHQNRGKPLLLGVFNPSPKQLRRSKTCLGFVLGLKRKLRMVVIGRNCFKNGRISNVKLAAPIGAFFLISKLEWIERRSKCGLGVVVWLNSLEKGVKNSRE